MSASLKTDEESIDGKHHAKKEWEETKERDEEEQPIKEEVQEAPQESIRAAEL
jgi:hypothetical protein